MGMVRLNYTGASDPMKCAEDRFAVTRLNESKFWSSACTIAARLL